MKDLKFLRFPESDKIATALYWGSEQVSDRLTVNSSQIEFAETALLAWTVNNTCKLIQETAPIGAKMILAPVFDVWNYRYMVEWFTSERINKLRIAFEAADEETETKLQEHLALVQVCVAHYNHFQKKVA
ncbi:hypothetical protein [Phaeodactylibacter xiamenensis]|uniref:hypothetical protein n=1 Tax=Phaeodactylibacter xiamenensis TaxID=1524460 RepID=UPI0024A7B213|nr:hypothetical protein [Phaeodactylibacter xiamenensis]